MRERKFDVNTSLTVLTKTKKEIVEICKIFVNRNGPYSAAVRVVNRLVKIYQGHNLELKIDRHFNFLQLRQFHRFCVTSCLTLIRWEKRFDHNHFIPQNWLEAWLSYSYQIMHELPSEKCLQCVDTGSRIVFAYINKEWTLYAYRKKRIVCVIREEKNKHYLNSIDQKYRSQETWLNCGYQIIHEIPSENCLKYVDNGSRIVFAYINKEWTLYAYGKKRIVFVITRKEIKNYLNNIDQKYESQDMQIQDAREKNELEKIAKLHGSNIQRKVLNVQIQNRQEKSELEKIAMSYGSKTRVKVLNLRKHIFENPLLEANEFDQFAYYHDATIKLLMTILSLKHEEKVSFTSCITHWRELSIQIPELVDRITTYAEYAKDILLREEKYISKVLNEYFANEYQIHLDSTKILASLDKIPDKNWERVIKSQFAKEHTAMQLWLLGFIAPPLAKYSGEDKYEILAALIRLQSDNNKVAQALITNILDAVLEEDDTIAWPAATDIAFNYGVIRARPAPDNAEQQKFRK